VTGPTVVFDTGTRVVDATTVQVSRLVEFIVEMVLIEVV